MQKDCDNKKSKIFNTTENQSSPPKIAYYILYIISIVQILIGLLSIIITQYYEITLTKYFYNTEKNQIQDELFFMKLFGIQLIITFIFGLILSKKLIYDLYTIHFGLLLTIWNLYNFLLIIYGILMCLMLCRAFDPIVNLAETSLLDGISEYATNIKWRFIWDTMQLSRECCGANTYQDWKNILVKVYNEEDCNIYKRGCVKNITSTPYSCCKLGGYCFNSESNPEDNGNDNIYDLPIVNINGINTRGCLQLFESDLTTLTRMNCLILGVTFFLQCLVLIIMRRLYVKMRNYTLSSNDYDSDDNCTPAIVIVKCPRNVKCITVPSDECYEEDKDLSGSCRNYCCSTGSQLVIH